MKYYLLSNGQLIFKEYEASINYNHIRILHFGEPYTVSSID